MKKIFASLILLIFVFIFVGCSSVKIKNDTFYSEYSFSAETQEFVKTGYRLKFTQGFSGYEMSIPNGFSIMGSAISNLNGYQLNLSSDVLTSLSGLDDLALADPDKYGDIVDQIKDSVSANQQVYFADKYMFSHGAIALMKSPDNKDGYKDIDGIYEYVSSESIKYRFKNGLVYKINIKTESGKTTESEEEYPVMRYTVQDRIINLIRIDKEGKDVYIENKLQYTAYFFGTITYPDDFADNFDESDSSGDYESAQNLAGKTLSVMATKYYCLR